VTPFSLAPLWYLTRSTGVVAFVLLTLSLILGVAATQRALASRAWPRFATQDLHRNLSLLGVVMLIVHILTTLLDSYVRVGWWAIVVPFTSPYRRLSVALGTMAVDLLVIIVTTSLLRTRLPLRVWRVIHWSAYALWPITLLHFLLTGTDAAHRRWGLWFGLMCILPVATASVLRLRTPDQPQGPLRSVAGSAR
jgi:predicted ferric reductase